MSVGQSNTQLQDLELLFLGTASMTPSTNRNVSALAMRVGTAWWVFDAGEGTQHQMVRSEETIRPSRVSRIFITHLHGDHVFGLPGLLCRIGCAMAAVTSGNPQVEQSATPMIEIVGPRGLRAHIRNIMRATSTRIPFQYTVHELHWPDARGRGHTARNFQHNNRKRKASPGGAQPSATASTPGAHGVAPAPASASASAPGPEPEPESAYFSNTSTLHACELAGTDVQPTMRSDDDEQGGGWHWVVPSERRDGCEFDVLAAPVDHTVPCVGFVVVECPRAGVGGKLHMNAALELHDEPPPGTAAHQADDATPAVAADRATISTAAESTTLRALIKEPGCVAACSALYGVPKPAMLLSRLKAGEALQMGATAEEGRGWVGGWVWPKECVAPPPPRRKVVVLGDTRDSRRIAPLAAGATVLVHESTNAYLATRPAPPPPDIPAFEPPVQAPIDTAPSTELSVMARTYGHGHSTPRMAGWFARDIGCERLVLTHFSPRYKGRRPRVGFPAPAEAYAPPARDRHAELVARDVMTTIAAQAAEAMGGGAFVAASAAASERGAVGRPSVITSEDFMSLLVRPQPHANVKQAAVTPAGVKVGALAAAAAAVETANAVRRASRRFISGDRRGEAHGGLSPEAAADLMQRCYFAAAPVQSGAAATTAGSNESAQAQITHAVDIAAPWPAAILRGEKEIETREYALPPDLIGKEVAIVETSRARCVHGGGKTPDAALPPEVVVGTVIFSESFEYTDEAMWARDEARHLVPCEHPVFGWKHGVPKWGWRVKPGSQRVFDEPRVVPALLRVVRSVFLLGRPLDVPVTDATEK